MKTLILLCSFALSLALQAGTLKIEDNEVLKSITQEFQTLGSSPEIYPFSEKYRLDLSLMDLVDQASLVAEDYDGLNEKLKAALATETGSYNFIGWLNELKKSAEENSKLKNDLDKSLYMQFYSPRGVALLPDYKYIDFQKIKDNGKLVRIGKYNRIANDPESIGILSAFEIKEWKGFYTRSLTVTKIKNIKFKALKNLQKNYYKVLIDLYVKHLPPFAFKHQPSFTFKQSKHGLKTIGYMSETTSDAQTKANNLFNILHQLPNKHQILFALSQKIPDMPYENGMYILGPVFIKENFAAIENGLKEITIDQIIHSEDDRYLLSVRNYIQKNIQQIEADLIKYNQANATDLKLLYVNRSHKPRRIEAVTNIEMLLALYPGTPWLTKNHGVLFDRKGKEVYLDKKVAHFFIKLGNEIIQTETYLSILAGTATLIITQGNVPVAMSTQKLVKRAIETQRYDKDWEEFLKEAPKDVIDALLMGSGFGAGRFFKIVALGAGQGFLQSLFTGQDLRTGAAVGAGLNIIQFYIIPTNISRPMTKGFDAKSLAMNRKLELLEKTVKAGIQGATVAALDGQDILKAGLKGSVYGLVSTQLLIWFVGTRYYPFKAYDPAAVDDMIDLENEYQNLVGRGGEYAINRQLILDANYRVGGVLPDMITASITLPGNVAMSDKGFKELTTLTHESHHLMQQHQTGVFGFYLFRYIPTGLRTGYNGHPDENFLKDIL
jgi:hypothetical protein